MRSFDLTTLREEWVLILLIMPVTLITCPPFIAQLGF